MNDRDRKRDNTLQWIFTNANFNGKSYNQQEKEFVIYRLKSDSKFYITGDKFDWELGTPYLSGGTGNPKVTTFESKRADELIEAARNQDNEKNRNRGVS